MDAGNAHAKMRVHPATRPRGGSHVNTSYSFSHFADHALKPGMLVRVRVDCGIPLVASITRASAEDMGLAAGGRVIATFKASAVHLIPLPD